MFEKIKTKFDNKKGIIDAETSDKYRIKLKDSGYNWVFKHEIVFISDAEYSNEDVTEKDIPKPKFRHHNVEEGY